MASHQTPCQSITYMPSTAKSALIRPTWYIRYMHLMRRYFKKAFWNLGISLPISSGSYLTLTHIPANMGIEYKPQKKSKRIFRTISSPLLTGKENDMEKEEKEEMPVCQCLKEGIIKDDIPCIYYMRGYCLCDPPICK